MDSDEEDEALTPDDNLIADILAAEREQAKKDKKDKKEVKFDQIVIQLAEGEPDIDGDLSDPFWKQAHPSQLSFEVSPARLAEAKMVTRAWFAATSTHIYVAFDAEDPNPERIRSGLRAHDGGKEDDYVSFAIDTTGTGARKYEFRVNPHGSKGDTINDSVADRSGHDWDTDWEAAAMIHNNGYRVEMAIPIAGIRAPARTIDGRKGVIFLKRYIPRRLKTVNAGFIIYDGNQLIEEIRRREAERPSGSVSVADKLSGTAHAIYHLDQTRKIGESEWAQVAAHDEFSGGLDLVYQFDSARSAALTLYPNYTDVEGDIARDGLSKAFKKFKPEKRSFFKAVSEYYISTVPSGLYQEYQAAPGRCGLRR